MKTKKITALFLISLLLSLPVFGHDLFFKLDSSMERGSRILSIMDELGLDDTKDV